MGSSPLTRGKLRRGNRLGHVTRLIPAHAGKTCEAAGRPLHPQAHPRSRGENGGLLDLRDNGRGSSPLTRGKHRDCPARHDRSRLIPAHAGKTSVSKSSTDGTRAHPRSRGENGEDLLREARARGSSPLTRGKRGGSPGGCRGGRLIPAHAGKTRLELNAHEGPPAHPRSRGENANGQRMIRKPPGSSPLTRGKLVFPGLSARTRRLIPAHAGKTGQHRAVVALLQAHPRSRGENTGGGGLGSHDLGSSPLTRGKLQSHLGGNMTGGLIPAHAGKTGWAPTVPGWRWAHPRSRGENGAPFSPIFQALGSSPLTRGKRWCPPPGRSTGGLIPAHAGKTSRKARTRALASAHPRSRGENVRAGKPRSRSGGSSPLTRGKRLPEPRP